MRLLLLIISFVSILSFPLIASAQQNCLTGADLDCSGDVNVTEVMDYIGLWYGCSTCHPELFQVIEAYYGIYTTPPPAGFPTDYVSWWKFDGDALDENGRNNGTLKDNANITYDWKRDYGANTNGYVLSLDGTGDYVDVGDPGDGSFDIGMGEFSVSAWFNANRFRSNAGIIDNRHGSSGNYWSMLLLSDKKVRFFVHDGSTLEIVDSGTLFEDTWYHAVAIVNRTNPANGLRLYVNGVLVDRGNLPQNPINNSLSVWIGREVRDFNGSIDDVMIYNRSLSEDEIRKIYDSQKHYCAGISQCSGYQDYDSCTNDACSINKCKWESNACSKEVSDTWYVRPFGGSYGNVDGSRYDDAWNGLENIVWGPGGVEAGDTLYICGLHLRNRTGGSAWVLINPKANGVSEKARIMIDGDCPSGQGIDRGIIWGAGLMVHEPWVDEGNNVWSITDVGTPNSNWYFEDVTADSWKVLKRAANISEVQATPGSYFGTYNVGDKFYLHTTYSGDPTGRITVNRLGYHLYVTDNHYITWKNISFYGIHGWIDYSGSGQKVTNMRWENTTIWYGDFIHFLFRNGNKNIEFIDNDIGWASNGIGFAEYPYNSGNAPNNITIRGNKIHDIGMIYGTSDSHGIAAQGSNNVLIENNEIYNAGSGFTIYCEANQQITNYTVRWNWVHDTHYNFSANSRGIEFSSSAYADNTSGNKIYGNIVGPNVGGVGYKYNWEETAEFYNNICYDCGQSFVFGHHLRRVRVEIKNIISLNPRRTHIEYRSHESPGEYMIDSDYNIFYPISGKQFFFYEYALAGGPDWGNKNLTEWQALAKNGSTFDTHSFSADPSFVSPLPNILSDFKLNPGSPAIDAGIDVGLFMDMFGNAIPQDGDGNGTAEPDIGAYEHP